MPMPSPSQIPAALEELAALLGPRLSRSDSGRALHGRSESYFPETPPEAVAYPADTAEVARIVTICARHGCPVTGWKWMITAWP